VSRTGRLVSVRASHGASGGWTLCTITHDDSMYLFSFFVFVFLGVLGLRQIGLGARLFRQIVSMRSNSGYDPQQMSWHMLSVWDREREQQNER
jgi:hypothetical protein